jgi:hypothetical protein
MGKWEGRGKVVTYLPQRAEYRTLMMMSVGSMILGIGRSWTLTSSLPLKTTAFMVFFDILTAVDVAPAVGVSSSWITSLSDQRISSTADCNQR